MRLKAWMKAGRERESKRTVAMLMTFPFPLDDLVQSELKKEQDFFEEMKRRKKLRRGETERGERSRPANR